MTGENAESTGLDRLSADGLTALLQQGAPLPLPLSVSVLSETSSTNDVVAGMGRAGVPGGAVVFAETQTAGRGRLGRRWESAAHLGLWFSLLLRPRFAVTEWTRIATWVAVAVARGIESVLPGCRAGIKWPNDVHLHGRKAVGILIESSLGSGIAESFVVVGIGVNVNHQTADFPDELRQTAISLREASGPGAPLLDRHAVAAALLRSLSEWYAIMETDFASIVAQAQARSVLQGKRVVVQSAGGAVEGVVEALETDGALRLRCDSGEIIAVSSGEATIGQLGRSDSPRP